MTTKQIDKMRLVLEEIAAIKVVRGTYRDLVVDTLIHVVEMAQRTLPSAAPTRTDAQELACYRANCSAHVNFGTNPCPHGEEFVK